MKNQRAIWVAISPDWERKWCRLAITDITVSKEAEAVVRRNESLFSALIDQAPVGVYVVDQHLRLLQVNPKALSVFDQFHPLLNRNISDIMHILWPKAVAAEVVRQFKLTLQTGKPFKATDFSEIRQDSRTTESYDWQIQRINLPSGQHGVVCFFNDITERMRAEEAIARLAAIVKSSEDAIISKNLRGRITTWNRGAERLFGYRAEEAIGQPISMIFARPHLKAGISKRVQQGEAIESFETVCRHNGGRSLDVSLAISPIINAQGRIVGTSKIMRDITQQKRVQAAQRRAEVMAASNQKLKLSIARQQVVETALKASQKIQHGMLAESHRMREQLQQLARQILSTQEDERRKISRELHDVIAQTLAGINVHLGALKIKAATNSKGLDRKIADTQRLVEHSVNIVHQFARDLRPTVLDDLGLIPALHSYLKHFTAQTGVRAHLKAFADVQKLDAAKRTVFYRVAQEALTNVARHAQASHVEVSLEKLRDHVGMKITDNGKSFRVQRVLHSRSGKHLGLLGMRERVEMVGGSFSVESAPGKGTTIVAQIPFTKKRGGGESQVKPASAKSKIAMKKISVLLTEDHIIVREGFRMMLELDDGIEVIAEAQDGRQAVALAKKFYPDVVLMDIAMPLLNGLEATRQLLKERPLTKILMLSAHNDDAYVQNAIDSGAMGFLLKQTSAHDVCRAIREVHAGKKCFSPSIAMRLDQRNQKSPHRQGRLKKKNASLTSREREVLQLIAEGKTNKQTAAELGIGLKTVEKHREHLMAKLDIHDTAGLTRYAISAGIIESGAQLTIV